MANLLISFPYFVQCLTNYVNVDKTGSSCYSFPNNSEICTTPGCTRAANVLLTSLDATADPCEDFYQFACGKWLESTFIPDDKSSIDQYTDIIADQTEFYQRSLYEIDSAKEVLPKRLVRTFYRKCMDKDASSAEKSLPVWKMLNSLTIQWPVLAGNNSNVTPTFDVTDLVSEIFNKFGTTTLISGGVGVDDKNSSQYIYGLSEWGLSFESEYYLNDTEYGKYQQALKKYMIDIISLLATDAGVPVPVDLNKQVEEMYQFEKRLAQITPSPELQRNITARYNKFTVKELQAIVPWLKWEVLLKSQFAPAVKHLVTPSMPLLVTSPKYFSDLGSLVHSTDSRIIANVILFNFVASFVDNLDERFEAIVDEYSKALSGREQIPARWKRCVWRTSRLDKAAGALFVAKYFDQQSREVALNMVKSLKQTYSEMLSTNDWMDQATRLRALKKLSTIYDHIGYDSWLLNDTRLTQYYEGLNFEDSFTPFEVLEAVRRWSIDFNFKKLLKPVDKKEFFSFAPEVNAFYDPVQNSITFPAGILQPPFFDRSFPQSINYGAIGAIVGHEMTHGFDDQGRLYDDNGDLNDWWTPESSKRFDSKATCMADQYSNYKFLETDYMAVNGRLTLGENIADNGGLKIAYRAYKEYIKQLGKPEPALPGMLQFSNEQLFFLSYANSWCGKTKPDAAVSAIFSDVHAPPKARVLGPLTNMPEFATAFKCKKNTAMNPPSEKRCQIW